MQNFESNPQDSLSAQEARAVMEAITHRQQAAGANLDGKSVETLANGLGVTQDEVRKILEDIRVQRRSEQLAAGILNQEQKHRKRLDVTAAIGAAIAILLVVVAVTGFLFVRSRSSNVTVTLPDPVPIEVPAPPAPVVNTGMVRAVNDDGTVSYVGAGGVHVVAPEHVKEADKLWAKLQDNNVEQQALESAVDSLKDSPDNVRDEAVTRTKAELEKSRAKGKELVHRLDAISKTIVSGDAFPSTND